jgi:hypothetical protein
MRLKGHSDLVVIEPRVEAVLMPVEIIFRALYNLSAMYLLDRKKLRAAFTFFK